ncbi:MAG TPA: DnaJ domain-containing protein [Candidatus Sulfotelmatobacter sp.]|nr:DnaJ domain-containing protein [Candidatus Sulfotelmatobacter sp.]
MPLEATDLNTIDDLYAFVEKALHQTGLVLDADAPFRPWARTVSAGCNEVRWVYPSRPLPELLLQHLANFAHRPLPDKGFVLFQMGQLVRVIDVDVVEGSSQPHRLAAIVREAFSQKRRAATRNSGLSVGFQGNPLDPYQVLGASEMDSEEEIKKKYKQMVSQYHPDRVAHLGSELKELAARKTTEINCAFAAIRQIRGF